MGGSSGGTRVIQSTPPPQPTYQQTIQDYINAYPQLFALQQQYAPQEAQQQADLFAQYGPQMAQTLYNTQDILNPGINNLTQQLTQQATQGASGNIPEAQRQAYLDQLRAELGSNAGSPIGADYVSRGLINQNEQYRQYYQNLGLSLANRQPVGSPQAPGYTNQLAQANVGNIGSFNAGNYSTYAGAARPQLGTYGTPNWILGLQAGLNAGGQIGGAMALGCWVAKEIYGDWDKEEVHYARYFIYNMAPKYFMRFYHKNAKGFSVHVKNNKILKFALKQIFDVFVALAKREVNNARKTFRYAI